MRSVARAMTTNSRRVGQLIRDAFAGAYAETQQKRRGAFDALEQLLPGERDVASFARFDDG